MCQLGIGPSASRRRLFSSGQKDPSTPTKDESS
jgi:hypothetical protein